jgi:hypothetical protein
MTFDQFRRLVRAGEKATVDFKLLCNAFNKGAGDHEKAKAELVKDICAMANNGGQVISRQPRRVWCPRSPGSW